MVIVILGKSNSGKTTFVKHLEKKYNIKTVVTCTTRLPRKGEIDGVHYHFISDVQALQHIWNGDFIEYTEYNVASGEKWLYGTRKQDIDTNKMNIIVLNPEGYRVFKERYGNKVISILIKPNSFKRLLRIIKRDKGSYRESLRRYISDYKDFKDIKADIIIKDFKI